MSNIQKLELEAATNDINAQLAENRAKEKRSFVDQLNREADDIDANILNEEEKLEKGYWLCENGHEQVSDYTGPAPLNKIISCYYCKKDATLIKLDQMTGQGNSGTFTTFTDRRGCTFVPFPRLPVRLYPAIAQPPYAR